MFPLNLRFRRFLKFTFQPAAAISRRADKRGKVMKRFKVKYWIFAAEVCYQRRRNEAHRSGQSSLSCDHVINPLVAALMSPLGRRVLPRHLRETLQKPRRRKCCPPTGRCATSTLAAFYGSHLRRDSLSPAHRAIQNTLNPLDGPSFPTNVPSLRTPLGGAAGPTGFPALPGTQAGLTVIWSSVEACAVFDCKISLPHVCSPE